MNINVNNIKKFNKLLIISVISASFLLVLFSDVKANIQRAEDIEIIGSEKAKEEANDLELQRQKTQELLESNEFLSSDVPQVLYDRDLKLYKEIFSLQDRAEWKKSREKMEQLDNKILLGYLEFQRYMHSRYKSNYKQLKKWLNEYSDMPEAKRIYKLALKKGPKSGLHKPQTPSRTSFYVPEDHLDYEVMIKYSYRHLSSDKRKLAKKLIKNFKRAIARGYTKNAKDVLRDPRTKKYIKKGDYYRMSASLAFKYFIDNYDEFAIEWATPASDNHNVATANWTLGLIYWRKGNYVNSKKYFKRLATTKGLSPWMASAANYWVHKSNDKIDYMHKEKEDYGEKYLEIASFYDRTFYGILASAHLDKDVEENWDVPTFTFQNAKELISWQGGLRAIALLQLKKYQKLKKN